MSVCYVAKDILEVMKDVSCTYKDIIYIDDHTYKIADGVKLCNDDKYVLNQSDYFKVSCFGYDKKGSVRIKYIFVFFILFVTSTPTYIIWIKNWF